MKLLKIIVSILATGIISSMYLSCTKQTPQIAPLNSNLSTLASVQVFSATVKASRNYIYVDNITVSGAALSYGGVFPGTAYAFTVNPGSRTFLIKDTLPATTQIPLTFSQTMEAGKSYTIFTYDTITSVKQLTVTNNIQIPTDTTARLRFANFAYSPSVLPPVDVYSFRKGTTTPVFSNIGSDQVTDFIPYISGSTDTLYVYATGTTSPLLAKSLVTSLTQTRSYTSVYSGSYVGKQTISTFATY
ncbi:MAG: DUF4397 domain-containing protein [Bacteroidota bacterium]|nr:DUF4397 domain-containing protein [Bacteroidota bacterium]